MLIHKAMCVNKCNTVCICACKWACIMLLCAMHIHITYIYIHINVHIWCSYIWIHQHMNVCKFGGCKKFHQHSFRKRHPHGSAMFCCGRVSGRSKSRFAHGNLRKKRWEKNDDRVYGLNSPYVFLFFMWVPGCRIDWTFCFDENLACRKIEPSNYEIPLQWLADALQVPYSVAGQVLATNHTENCLTTCL